MKHTINCGTDLDLSSLDTLLADHPELAILKDLGEIVVEIDGSVKGTDESFDAYNKAGGLSKVEAHGHEVTNLEVSWFPDESDIEHAVECEVEAKVLAQFKSKVLAEPKNLKYELVQVLSADALQEIEEALIEENRE